MAIQTLNDARIYVAQFNLSGDHNKINLEIGTNDSPDTVFGDTAESVKGTTNFINLTGEGFVTLGTTAVHSVLSEKINISDVPVTISYQSNSEDDYAEFFLASVMRYNPFAAGDVGEHMGFQFDAKAQGTQSIQGIVKAIGSKTTTASGTGADEGVIAATKTIYAVQHVLSVSGTNPTLDTIIQSDTTGFGSPTTRLTFAQTGVVGAELVSAAGPGGSDDFWRANWTIGGTDTPTFDIVVVFGFENTDGSG